MNTFRYLTALLLLFAAGLSASAANEKAPKPRPVRDVALTVTPTESQVTAADKTNEYHTLLAIEVANHNPEEVKGLVLTKEIVYQDRKAHHGFGVENSEDKVTLEAKKTEKLQQDVVMTDKERAERQMVGWVVVLVDANGNRVAIQGSDSKWRGLAEKLMQFKAEDRFNDRGEKLEPPPAAEAPKHKSVKQ